MTTLAAIVLSLRRSTTTARRTDEQHLFLGGKVKTYLPNIFLGYNDPMILPNESWV